MGERRAKAPRAICFLTLADVFLVVHPWWKSPQTVWFVMEVREPSLLPQSQSARCRIPDCVPPCPMIKSAPNNREIRQVSKRYPVVELLQQIRGVGPLALSWVTWPKRLKAVGAGMQAT